MATESIGELIPTAIPGYADAADIQAALRAYHYGSYAYSPANTSPGNLVSPSMAKTIYDIQQDIVDLENRPSSGGDVANTAPVPGDFTPSGIPNGYIWVDQDGTIGGAPISATAVFTASAPTSNLSTGVIWVDQDPASITDNPFIATALMSAKGDLIVATANDAASVLNVAATNGYVLNVNSATTSGLAWVDSAATTQTLTNKSIALGSNTLTGTIAQFNTALSDGDFATLAGTQTLTNKTVNLSNNTLSGTISEFNTALSDADFATLAGTETLTNKTISGTSNTITNVSLTTGVTGTLPVANGGTGITSLGSGIATFLGTPSSANLAAALTDETGSGAAVFGTSPTLTSPTINTATVSNSTLVGPEERFNIVASAATGTVNIDALTAGVWYYTSNATGNHTLNFRGSASTSMNAILTTGDSITVLWLNTNGTTAYYPNVYQVDGTTSGVTVNWSGGTAPSAGNASAIDVYSFTIIKTADATFRILAAGAVKYS